MEKKTRELIMAKLYLKNRDYKMAEKSFNEHLGINPDDVGALKLLATVHEHNKRFDKAFEMYERCYLAEPDRTGVLLDICRILLMNEIWLEHVDYRKWLNLAIRAFPSNPIVANFKAFLATLPPDDQTSPKRETVSQAAEKNSPGDPLVKILEKLTIMEKRLETIEERIGNLSSEKTNTTNPTTTSPIKDTSTGGFNFSGPSLFPSAIPSSTNLFAASVEKFNVPTDNQWANSPFSFSKPKEIFQAKKDNDSDADGQNHVENEQLPIKDTSTGGFNFSSPSLFSSAIPSSTNLFAASIEKFNVPTDNQWANSPFSFSKPKEVFEVKKDNDGDADGQDHVENEELPIENTCTMKPVEIKSGEEDEDVLFEHRCKLFRLRDKEYKERGLGSIKVLKHRKTGKGRLIMRREAIGLVCLNCWDCKNVERVRDTQVRWSGFDASDGEPEATVLVVKFKTAEITDTFNSHLKALFPDESSMFNANKKEEAEIELVDPKLDQSLVDKARALELPDLFYHKIKNQGPCNGCDGCEKDD